MKVKKFDFLLALKYVALFFVCLVLANAKLNDISPFLFAFFIACLYCGVNEKWASCFVGLTYVLIHPSLKGFLIAITVVSVGLISFYAHKIAKKKIRLVTNFLVFLCSQCTYIYYNFSSVLHLVYYLLLGLVCVLTFIIVLQTVVTRKNCLYLTLDESICFLFFVAVLGLGLSTVQIYDMYVYRFILCLMILVCVAVNNITLTYSLTLAFSLGVSISFVSLVPVAEFSLMALISCLFSMPNKYKIALSAICVECFTEYFFFSFSLSSVFRLVPILLACLVFVFLPNKTLNSLSDFVYVKKGEITSRNLINTTRKSIRRRMTELSNIFLDMKRIHTNMVKKDLTRSEVVAMFNREIMSSCCKDCIDKNKCTRSLNLNNASNIDLLIEKALEKGKLTLLDVPTSLTNRCDKVNTLISLVNRLNDEYRQYKTMVSDVNNVKILLADQMGAVSNLLLGLGKEIDSNVKFDIAKENKIISKLLSQNVQTREVLLFNEKSDETTCLIIMKNEFVVPEIIEKTISEVVKQKMEITKIVPLEEQNFVAVNLKKKSKFDCVFGLASCNKAGNKESGDCHSIIRLGASKLLLALCDGMGAGEQAHRMSAMTLGLIENFYKVGFDNDIILESVNKLLAVNNQENYSTLDICLLDMEQMVADFIKVGSPFGVVKKEKEIELIAGGALPIGALDSVHPATQKSIISTKDIVIMATDGITDAFSSTDEFSDFVSKLASTNPQTIAESILQYSLEKNNMQAKDDMTVLVARIYLKNN